MNRKNFVEELKNNVELWYFLVHFLYDANDGQSIDHSNHFFKVVESGRGLIGGDLDIYNWVFLVDNLLLSIAGYYTSEEGPSLEDSSCEDIIEVKAVEKLRIEYEDITYVEDDKQKQNIREKIKEIQESTKAKQEIIEEKFLDI